MLKITAIGEILFDLYPESKNLGGAPLNFLYHIYMLTRQGNIISRIGSDVLGKKVLDFLNNSGIYCGYIQEDHNHPTGVTTVTLDENKVPTFSIDINTAYDFIESSKQLDKLIELETDCLYFGSLAQRGKVTRGTVQSLLNKNIKYFCDLNIRHPFYTTEVIEKSITVANVLKINIDELELMHRLFLKNSFDLYNSSSELMKKFNIDLLAVTKGAEGSVLMRDTMIDDFKLDPVEVIDTVGAGDAFSAILCLGYLKNLDLNLINQLANEFAIEICKIKGALPETDSVYKKFSDKIKNAR
ncbi:MAG: PfkB family carbohydrate kinase [Ignavibacteriaceae bacterium]|nr:PfkB family carbohydrate kinase [Ignavibacteriaceae bacterium]MCW9066472.1 PfkB family carbohydrate kinase [Ignavibacteriaceae bacterium]